MRNKILAGAAGAAAIAAGYYFYAHKNAKKHRSAAAKWAMDFKGDVMDQAQQLKKIDRSSLVGIIDGVTRAYESVRNLNQNDLMAVAEELKSNWKKLQAELTQTSRAASREARKTVNNAAHSARKTARKVTSKVKKSVR